VGWTPTWSTLGPSLESVGGTSFLFHNLALTAYIEKKSGTGRALDMVRCVYDAVVGLLDAQPA
jgi:hypothetical protein